LKDSENKQNEQYNKAFAQTQAQYEQIKKSNYQFES